MNYMMKRTLFLAILGCSVSARAEKTARIEIIDPFQKWFLMEDLELYLLVTNTGDEPLPLDVGSGDAVDREQYFFEVDPNSIDMKYKAWISNALLTKGKDLKFTLPVNPLILPPGSAYMLSNLDYEQEGMRPEVFNRFRVNLLIENGKWVSSDFIERNIINAPDLSVPSLFEYKYKTSSDVSLSVISLVVGEETWLFRQAIRNNHFDGLKRLCRVPEGNHPTFEFDNKSSRLIIRFDGGEEPVVFNTRTGKPVSGSERTVPQLHLWKRLAERPFTDFWEMNFGTREGKANARLQKNTTVLAAVSDNYKALQKHAQSKISMNSTMVKQTSKTLLWAAAVCTGIVVAWLIRFFLKARKPD